MVHPITPSIILIFVLVFRPLIVAAGTNVLANHATDRGVAAEHSPPVFKPFSEAASLVGGRNAPSLATEGPPTKASRHYATVTVVEATKNQPLGRTSDLLDGSARNHTDSLSIVSNVSSSDAAAEIRRYSSSSIKLLHGDSW